MCRLPHDSLTHSLNEQEQEHSEISISKTYMNPATGRPIGRYVRVVKIVKVPFELHV
jgi:hypothetical protein